MSILDEILSEKVKEVEARKSSHPVDSLKSEQSHSPRGFVREIREGSYPSIIAEIKRASPSKGLIREDLDPLQTAAEYSRAGARCLSVLTDEKFFKGKLSFLKQVRASGIQCPLLRKDFIIDPYQVWESRSAGADALLLIAAALSEEQLGALMQETLAAELDILLEVHNTDELEQAISVLTSLASELGSSKTELLLGINNRNLHTFETNLGTTKELVEALPELIRKFQLELSERELVVVSESGISSGKDLALLRTYGAKAFLIGESLVRSGSPEANLRKLIEDAREARE